MEDPLLLKRYVNEVVGKIYFLGSNVFLGCIDLYKNINQVLIQILYST